MIKKILESSAIIRILIFLVTAIIFITIFIISKDKVEEKSNSLNIKDTYVEDNSFEENILDNLKISYKNWNIP